MRARSTTPSTDGRSRRTVASSTRRDGRADVHPAGRPGLPRRARLSARTRSRDRPPSRRSRRHTAVLYCLEAAAPERPRSSPETWLRSASTSRCSASPATSSGRGSWPRRTLGPGPRRVGRTSAILGISSTRSRAGGPSTSLLSTLLASTRSSSACPQVRCRPGLCLRAGRPCARARRRTDGSPSPTRVRTTSSRPASAASSSNRCGAWISALSASGRAAADDRQASSTRAAGRGVRRTASGKSGSSASAESPATSATPAATQQRRRRRRPRAACAPSSRRQRQAEPPREPDRRHVAAP